MTALLAAPAARRAADLWPTPTPGTFNVLPTYDGSGKTIHPSVLDMGWQFGGYRWWMADTPYPDQNYIYENPCIWASNDRINWVVPDGVTNPLAPAPTNPAMFNFDTELVWDPDLRRMICFWRFDDGLWAAWTRDGHNWSVLPQAITTGMTGASEAIVREGPGQWKMWLMRPAAGVDLRLWTATDPLGTWTLQQDVSTGVIDPNHGDIIKHRGIYMGVVYSEYAPGPAYPIASTDGVTWATGPVIPGMTVYRTTLLPSTEAGFLDVWYSTLDTQRVTYTRLPESLFLNLLG